MRMWKAELENKVCGRKQVQVWAETVRLFTTVSYDFVRQADAFVVAGHFFPGLIFGIHLRVELLGRITNT
jgi:hypothetical protein